MTVLAILQARMSSSRLPGKVMRPILGVPMIGLQIERLRRVKGYDALIVATSVEPSDDPLAVYLAGLDIPVFRGPLNDVLARFIGALDAFGPAEHVARLTADCPLCDPELNDACVRSHLETGADYSSIGLERTYPRGLDNEIFRSEALRAAQAETDDAYDREHVTPFLYRRPERFRLNAITQSPACGDWGWTVDTPEDFAFATRVYQALYPAKPDFTSADIAALPFAARLI